MKRMFLAAAVLALAAYLAAPAAAAEKSLGVTGSLALNYWISDFDITGNGWAMNGDQDYLPSFKALVSVSNPWSAILEYDNAGGESINDETGVTIGSEKSRRFLIGARYDFPGMVSGNPYVTLSHNEFKETTSYTNATSDSTKIKGLRLGGGYAFKFEGTPWTANVDLGFGISNKFKDSDGTSSKASTFDYDLGASYKFKGAVGLKANLGYKGLRYKVKADEVSNIDAFTIKAKGLYLGVGYDFN